MFFLFYQQLVFIIFDFTYCFFKGDLKEDLEFELNSKVLCKYRDSLYYEAKVIAIDDSPDQGKTYTVHYQVGTLGFSAP